MKPQLVSMDAGPGRRWEVPLYPVDHNGKRTDPHIGQQAFLQSRHWVTALIAGYGYGKTRIMLLLLIFCLLMFPGYVALLLSDTEPHVMLLLNTLAAMGLFPPVRKGQPATARARVWGLRKSPIISDASRQDRYIYLRNGSKLYLGSAQNPPGFDGLECHGVFWDEATLGRFDPSNAAYNAWKVASNRCRMPPRSTWNTLPPMGMRISTVPRSGTLRDELEHGLPCNGKMQRGRFKGAQICHRPHHRTVVIHGDTRENRHLSKEYLDQLVRSFGHEGYADELLGGQWSQPGASLLPGWSDAGIDWKPNPLGEHHLKVDFGSLTGHALLSEKVLPDDPRFPADRAVPGLPCYVVVDEVRLPTSTPEAFPEVCFRKWSDRRITRIIGDQAGLAVAGGREKKRGTIVQRSTYLQAWNRAINRHRQRNPNLRASAVEYTTDKHDTSLDVSVPWLASLICDVEGRTRYFWATHLQGKEYGTLGKDDRRKLYGVVTQGREYCRDKYGRIPGHDRGVRWDGIDAVRYHALLEIGTPPKPTARFAPDTLGITH